MILFGGNFMNMASAFCKVVFFDIRRRLQFRSKK